jgi:hypothetical protein
MFLDIVDLDAGALRASALAHTSGKASVARQPWQRGLPSEAPQRYEKGFPAPTPA